MTAQILAAVIFVGMFALIIMDKFERQYVTLGSAALVLVVVFGICMHSWDAIKNALNLGAIFRAGFWYGASESASSSVTVARNSTTVMLSMNMARNADMAMKHSSSGTTW